MSPRFGHMVQIDTPKDPEHVLKINFWSYEKGSKLKEFMIDYVEDGVPRTSEAFMMEGRKDIDFLGKTSDNGAAIDFQELMLGFVWGHIRDWLKDGVLPDGLKLYAGEWGSYVMGRSERI
ncbi:hypothetical protein BGZ80_008710 [Entomortierella chlamydospora]|uniref:Uncharacterized protein n=1 Tax=Entomortierella chlamydospora TaxID=101097 RepID=A0A9P6MY35_9FUNG|nr:hypothetical protein BGZ80_008710 [Entomortierella chlamydospora]